MVIKKALCFLLAACLLLTGLVGCGKAKPETADAPIDAVETLQPVTTETDTAEEPLSFADDEVLFIGMNKGTDNYDGGEFYCYNYKGEEIGSSQTTGSYYVYGKNGLAPAYHAASHKYGYINRDGEYVIEPQFDEAGYFADNGLAAVGIRSDSNEFSRDYGYINGEGEIVIPFQFFIAHRFQKCGFAEVWSSENRHHLIIDEKGQTVYDDHIRDNYSIEWFGKDYVVVSGSDLSPGERLPGPDRYFICNFQGTILEELDMEKHSYAIVDGELVRECKIVFFEEGVENVDDCYLGEEIYRNGAFVPSGNLYKLTKKTVVTTNSGFGYGVSDGEKELIPAKYDGIRKIGTYFICWNDKTHMTDVYDKTFTITAKDVSYIYLFTRDGFDSDEIFTLPDGFFRIGTWDKETNRYWVGIADKNGNIIIEPIFVDGVVCTATDEIFISQ